MARKPVTRFTINCDGRSRQLFKVNDRKGELSLIKNSKMILTGMIEGESKKEKFSIHQTKNNDMINTIKQTIVLSNGELWENIITTLAIKSRKLQLIYSYLCPDLRLPSAEFQKRNKDLEISLGEYFPNRQYLMYAVFVTGLSGPTQIQSCQKLRQIYRDFSQFRIIVVYSLIHIPSTDQGQMGTMFTSFPRVNGEKLSSIQVATQEGLDPSEALKTTHFYFNQLKDFAFGYALRYVSREFLNIFYGVSYGFFTEKELDRRVKKSYFKINK